MGRRDSVSIYVLVLQGTHRRNEGELPPHVRARVSLGLEGWKGNRRGGIHGSMGTQVDSRDSTIQRAFQADGGFVQRGSILPASDDGQREAAIVSRKHDG